MLQFRRFHSRQPFNTDTRAETLADRTDALIVALRDDRRQKADAAGPLWRTLERLDRRLRTTTLERLDRDEVSDERKLGIVEALHGLNVLLFSYWRFLAAVAPFVRRINQQEGRPARVVELAAGFGEFTLRAPEMARRMGLELEVTGTDIVPAYVERGRREAARRGVPASFEELDAFRMDVDVGRFDLAVIAQSMHHFSAGQLATMIAACRRVLTTGFVGIDGHRSFLLLLTVPTYAILFGRPARVDFAHDAILSGRKFFSEPELLQIGLAGAPDSAVDVRTSHPGYSVLTIDFQRSP